MSQVYPSTLENILQLILMNEQLNITEEEGTVNIRLLITYSAAAH